MAARSGRLGRLHAPETGGALIPDESRIPTVVAAVKGMLPLGSGAGGQLASRLERKLGISAAEARKRVTAYKQFLALKAASLDIDATKLSPPELVDAPSRRPAPSQSSAPAVVDDVDDADGPASSRKRA